MGHRTTIRVFRALVEQTPTIMSRTIVPLFFAALFPIGLAATDTSGSCTFAELAAQGKVGLSGTGLGAHMGESVSVQVRDLSGQGLVTVLPAGWVLASEDASVQDLMLVRAEPLRIAPGGTATVTCRAFCVEANDAGPGTGARFTLGRMANAQLVSLAEFVNAGDYPNDAVLFAVWTVTGERPISSIRADDMRAVEPLRRKVSEITGQTIPWYTVSYDDTRDDGRFSNEATRVTGRFDFRMVNNGVLRIVATDANGNVLSELGRDRHLGPGNYSMDIALTIRGWKRGTYSIRAYEGGSNLVERIDFTV